MRREIVLIRKKAENKEERVAEKEHFPVSETRWLNRDDQAEFREGTRRECQDQRWSKDKGVLTRGPRVLLLLEERALDSTRLRLLRRCFR